MTADRESIAARSFALHKAEHTMRGLVTNLPRAAALPYLVQPDRQPWRDTPAFIVGAGPSLSRSLPILEAASKVGYVVTVNAAAGAVASVVQPDLVVLRESVDVAKHLDGVEAREYALDLAASPAAWDAVAPRPGAGWFLAASVQTFQTAANCEARPLYGGTSALTAAVALAAARGANPIVLVGCDLAFAEDGAGYAPESAWGAVRGDVVEGGVFLSGMDAQVSAHLAAGQRPPPQAQSVVRRPAYGGVGEVSCLWTWDDQREWLSRFEDRHPYVMCFNCTGSGARIDGWAEVSIEVASPRLAPLPQRDGGAPSCGHVDAEPAIAALRDDATRIIAMCDAIERGETPDITLTTAVIEAMAAGDVLRARAAAGDDVAASIRGTYAALSKAARWTLEALS